MRLPRRSRCLILAATMAMSVTGAPAAPVAPAPGAAAPTAVAPSPTSVPTAQPSGETILLWPAGAPGAQRVTVQEIFLERAPDGPLRDRIAEHVTRPNLTLFHPRGAANGVTLLIVPGGGYVRVVIDKEGYESAEWFAAHGFECAVLRYRMPADGWDAGADAPVHDVLRAIRLLRSQQAARGGRLGVIGFSAGGHAVARAITDPATAYARLDAADDLSARPDFAVLVYPVIATTGVAAHAGSVAQLLAAGVTAAELDRFSPDLKVSSRTPPTLLIHAADDSGVPVENSLRMFAALRAHRVRSALHVFEKGGHGFGMRGVAGKDSSAWPRLVSEWALGAEHE